MSQTHWKKLTNPDFLGAYEILSIGHDLVLTIKSISNEMITGADGKKEECTIAKFKENVKPMILNKTNMKTIDKNLKYGPFVENWVGKQIQVYSAQVKAFGDLVDALRIRPTPPKAAQVEKVVCIECGNEIKAAKGQDGTMKSAKEISEKLGGLCVACWKKSQEVKADDTNGE